MKKISQKIKYVSCLKGSALAYALVIMSVCMIILVSMLSYTASQLKFSFNRAEKEKAFQISEAGIYFYRWYLAHQVSGKTAQEINDFWQGGTALGVSAPFEDDFKDPEGGVIGKYSIEVTPPDAGSTIVVAKATGWTNKEPNLKRTVQVRFRRPSWSEYAVLANHFMRFGTGTDVYGEIHCNEGIRFDGTAHNVVSSLAATLDDPDHSGGNEFGVHTHIHPPGVAADEAPPTDPVPTRNDIFLAGRQFPVPEVSFGGVSSDLSLMKKIACDFNEGTSSCAVVNNCSADGCYFDNSDYGRHIVLNSNGTMSVRRVTNYDKDAYDVKGRVLFQGYNTITAESAATSYTIPDNGIIFAEDNIWLEGTVNDKKVTVVAANTTGAGLPANVFLGINNLLYTNFDGRDVVGVIAQNNVEILKNSQNFLTLDAALLAQNGRVGREYYTCDTWKYEVCRLWRIDGILKLWSQVTSEERANGTCLDWDDWILYTPNDISDDYQHCRIWNAADHKDTITLNGSMATNLRYGFAYSNGTGYTNRILNFDNNLLYYPPPYFPTGTEYAIDSWEEL